MSIQHDKDLITRTVFTQPPTDDEWDEFAAFCDRTGLDPLLKQVYPQYRKDRKKNRNVMSIQVAIDGYRISGVRTGEYEGQTTPQWCGDDGVWHDAWLSDKPPVAARVGIWRKGFREPVWGVVSWHESVQTYPDGSPMALWASRPALMLAKNAESAAWRKAFPQLKKPAPASQGSAALTRLTEYAAAVKDTPLEHDPRYLLKGGFTTDVLEQAKTLSDEDWARLMTYAGARAGMSFWKRHGEQIVGYGFKGKAKAGDLRFFVSDVLQRELPVLDDVSTDELHRLERLFNDEPAWFVAKARFYGLGEISPDTPPQTARESATDTPTSASSESEDAEGEPTPKKATTPPDVTEAELAAERDELAAMQSRVLTAYHEAGVMRRDVARVSHAVFGFTPLERQIEASEYLSDLTVSELQHLLDAINDVITGKMTWKQHGVKVKTFGVIREGDAAPLPSNDMLN